MPFDVSVAGAPRPVPPDQVSVQTSLHHPDTIELMWHDQAGTMLEGVEIGQAVVVKGQAGGLSPEPLAEVEITAVELVMDGAMPYAVIRGLDKGHRLQRGSISRTYTDAKGSDIASQIASKKGVAGGKIDVTDVMYKHLTRFNETDWDFLQRLGAQNNRVVSIGKDGKLNFTKPPEPTSAPGATAKDDRVLTVGVNLTHLHATITAAQQVADIEVIGWDAKQAKAITGSNPSKSVMHAPEKAKTPAQLVSTFNAEKLRIAAPNLGSQAQVDAVAKTVGERNASASYEIYGEAIFTPKLRAGESVNITGLKGANTRFGGKYVLTAVRHVKDASGERTEFSITGAQDRSLVGLASGGSGNGNSSNGKVYGVFPAIVSNNKADEESDLKVKVKFPWLHDGTDATESAWARVVYLGAGQDRGTWFMPSVDDEVLVAFENGDPTRPYILGGLYNQNHSKIPESPGKQTKAQKAGKTNQLTVASDKLKFQMFDVKDDKAVPQLVLGTRDDKFAITINTNKDGLISIESKGKIEITASKDILISSTNKVTIDGKNVLINATAKLQAQANQGAEISGGSKVAITGGKIDIG